MMEIQENKIYAKKQLNECFKKAILILPSRHLTDDIAAKL